MSFDSTKNDWRVITRTSDAQLVVTSYQPQSRVGSHSHKFNLVGMLTHGAMDESIGTQQKYNCRPFDIGLQPAGVNHSNRIGNHGLRSVMILFNDSFAERLGVKSAHLKSYRFLRQCVAVRLGMYLYERIMSGRVSQDEFCSVVQEMFRNIVRQRDVEMAKKPGWLIKVLGVTAANKNWSLESVDTLARNAKCHPDYFSRCFKKHFGETYGNFKSRNRVCHAARMLAGTTISPAEIAMECGFSDQSHMTRMFKVHMGTPPARLRDLCQSRI